MDRQRLRVILDTHGVPGGYATMSERVPSAAALFERKRAWHQEQARLSLREKVRILIESCSDRTCRSWPGDGLRPWERPWEIAP